MNKRQQRDRFAHDPKGYNLLSFCRRVMHSDIEAILESTYDELNGKEDVEKVFVIGGKIRKIKAILGEQAHLDRDGVARVTLLTLQLFELYLKAMMYAEARIDDLETELKESRNNSSKEDARN